MRLHDDSPDEHPRPGACAGLPEYDRLSLAALENALATVPGYAPWRPLDPGPAASVDARYAALPALTKADLRVGPRDRFVPRGMDLDGGLARGEVEWAVTSGTTDDAVTLVFSAAWWEASERGAWGLNAHSRGLDGAHREAIVASPKCVGPGYSERPLPRSERTLGRHLYLNEKINPASWTDDDVRRMSGELNDHEPVVVEGDPAYLAPLARRAGELGVALARPRLVFLTYSYPSRLYLRRIREAFGAPVVSSYGSTETGHVFLECEAGRLHQNAAHGRVDFEPFRSRHGGPGRGRMLVSTFHNPWFPVLRFDIGDVARLADGPCPCGRTEGLTLATIEGRIKDVTFAADGRAVTVDDLDAALAARPGVEGWQLDLPEPGLRRLRLLADDLASAREARVAIESVFRDGIGTEVVLADALQHEPSGKFRFARAAYAVDHEVLWRRER